MSTPTAAEAVPLDEVMLAMDVVDTLRHSQDIAARELSAEARESQLIARLRDIYRQQGIEVSDDILKEGVAALAEKRFVYEPPTPGPAVALARLYVSRAKWGRPVFAILSLRSAAAPDTEGDRPACALPETRRSGHRRAGHVRAQARGHR